MLTRRFCSLAFAACASLVIVSSASAQYKLETCEDLKIAEAHFGINTVETATCVNPAKTFSPKGTLRNTRPDDLGGTVLRALLNRYPQVRKDEVDDVIIGCAMPEA